MSMEMLFAIHCAVASALFLAALAAVVFRKTVYADRAINSGLYPPGSGRFKIDDVDWTVVMLGGVVCFFWEVVVPFAALFGLVYSFVRYAVIPAGHAYARLSQRKSKGQEEQE